ncbi:Pentatricopeptide repeat-containing protein [Acorus calamus]|uniref:Pentatricopeptide repeat-containing protein n=1 Tax=Acorus calamus TaxID=4465 RepID=A0AAV9C4E9_ACOCL|nr:Pentatricopeptide repeat-containing protein [Acorus calamus]
MSTSPLPIQCLYNLTSKSHTNLPKTPQSIPSDSTTPFIRCEDQDFRILNLLRQRKTDEAWETYTSITHLPNTTCLSRLVAQLSYQNTPTSLSRARSIVRRLRDLRQLRLLDSNSLGLLAAASSRSSASLSFSASLIHSMLKSGYLPHVKAWSAVVSRLSSSENGSPVEALHLFDTVLRRVSSLLPDAASEARPDSAAFNAALNASANLGDVELFARLFGEMPRFGAKPDVLSYNILIKLCAQVGRPDLLVFVLERIIKEGLTPCITTLHSLIAAYVGFGDLDTAEKIIQSMREQKTDLCCILRNSSERIRLDGIDEVLEGLVKPERESDPPSLPKTYAPDARAYATLMKGYMKSGRVEDVLCTLEVMQREEGSEPAPDHVMYTTAVSALVSAGSMERARMVLAEMARAGQPANRVTYNVLLKGYCQQLQLDKAKDLVREMESDAGTEPDAVTYNTLINGCILVDDSTGALSYFNEMRARGIALTKVSYTTLMKAFALTGQPKLAQKVFDEMIKDPRVRVDLVAWNMLVEGYCRLGLVEEAKGVVSRMREGGFQPDVCTYGSLANGIAVARKPGEALLLWNEIKERCVKAKAQNDATPPLLVPDEGLLDTLADVCVRAAFFKKALEIVACMEENGISPNKTKYKRIYVEMHSRMFTSKHASKARQDRRSERKRAAEAFKFWLGLPNSYYGSEWRLEPTIRDEYDDSGYIASD